MDHADRVSMGFMFEQVESYLGDISMTGAVSARGMVRQRLNEGVLSQCGRGDALLRRTPEHLSSPGPLLQGTGL